MPRRYKTLHGIDIVPSVIRLCAMNRLLPNVGPSPGSIEQVHHQLLANLIPPDTMNDHLNGSHTVCADAAFVCKSSIKGIGKAGNEGGKDRP